MNEVNILNIGGIDYNIDDQLARDVIAHSENGLDSQSNLPVSSRHYGEGDYLIGQDRLYYEVTSDIEIGDVIAEGVNVRATIISEELVRLKNQSSIAVIQSIAKVESAALSSRNYVIGQYFYWDFGLAAGLYETIATITSGDAFSEGVNIKLANKMADTIDGLQDAYNITGAKNLCPNNAVDTVTTDITWDVLSDGSIQVSGTPAANRFLELGYVTLPPGTYKVTTLAGQNEENSRVWLTVYAGSGYSNVIARSNSSSGTPNTFTLAIEATVKMALNVSSGSAINTRVFPMCRVASITDESYVPFAMTNRQLSSQISKIATLERITTATGVQFAFRMGRIGFFTFEVTLTNATNGTVICSGLPRPQGVVYCSFVTITGLAVPCIFEADGALKVYYPNTTISGRVDGSLMYFIMEQP